MSAPLSEQEKAIVRALQQELPLVPEPYRVIAADLGLSEAALLEGIRSLQEKGCLKRISIALRHKNVGYKVNVMLVWDIPEAQIAVVGAAVSAHPAVTHCYKRNPRPDFLIIFTPWFTLKATTPTRASSTNSALSCAV